MLHSHHTSPRYPLLGPQKPRYVQHQRSLSHQNQRVGPTRPLMDKDLETQNGPKLPSSSGRFFTKEYSLGITWSKGASQDLLSVLFAKNRRKPWNISWTNAPWPTSYGSKLLLYAEELTVNRAILLTPSRTGMSTLMRIPSSTDFGSSSLGFSSATYGRNITVEYLKEKQTLLTPSGIT